MKSFWPIYFIVFFILCTVFLGTALIPYWECYWEFVGKEKKVVMEILLGIVIGKCYWEFGGMETKTVMKVGE